MSRVVLLISLVVVIGVAAVSGTAFAVLKGESVYPGVKVGGISVGGLTLDETEKLLSSRESDLANGSLNLRYGNKVTKAGIRALGGGVDAKASAQAAFDIGRTGNFLARIAEVLIARQNGKNLAPVLRLDKSKSEAFLTKLAKGIDRKPEDARPVVKKDSIRVIPEKTGVVLDIASSLARVQDAVKAGQSDVELDVHTANPDIKAADLAGIDGVLASYTTSFKPWEKDRTHNLWIATHTLDGTLIRPGEIFSYNKVIGPRLEKAGYREAKIFVKGQVESGLGGGVCQICTTVYNSALLANMKIVRRAHHSRPVTYAPIGRDATVAYPSIDFKFENNTGAPVFIVASIGKRTVTVTLYGKKTPGLQVSLLSTGHKIVPAPVVKKTASSIDPNDPPTKGRSGHRVTTYRIVKINGEVVKKELLHRDYYRPEAKVIVISKPEPKAAVTTAL